ncbi:MAG: PAS domain S-box protein [Rubrobacteraceae bacterium]
MRESEKLYRLIAENSTDMISKHTLEGVYTYVSPACHALLGYEPGDLLGRPAYDLFHPEDQSEIAEAHSAILESSDPETVSYRIRRKDGSYTWFETTSRVVREETGEASEILAVSRDITSRKQAEDALQKSNDRITDVLESITDAFFALDRDRCFSFVNRRAEQFLGRSREELLGTSVLKAFPESVGSRFYEESQKAAETGKPARFEEFYPPLGAWFEVRVYPSRDGLAVYFQDVTGRKQSEKELREAEERFRSAFDNTPVGMALVGLEGRYQRVNRAMLEILGYPENELLSKTYQELTYHEDYEISQEYVRRMEEEGLESYSLEKRYVHAGGHPVWVSLGVSLVKDAEGRPLYYIAQSQDITERKLAEKELRDYAGLLSEVISTQQEIATAELDYEAMLRLITERSQTLTGARGAVIELLENQDLVYYSGSGTSSEHVGLRLKLSSSVSGMCVREGKPLLSEDTETDPRVDRESCRKTGVRSLIVVPLYHNQETVGVLKVVSGGPHAFEDRDVYALQLMAGLIAAAMSHAAKFEAEQNLLAERTASLLSIQQSEARFRAIFEDTAAGIGVVDLHGKLLQTNPALQKMLGYSARELDGIHIADITHPDDAATDLSQFGDLVVGELGSYELEKRYVRKNGSLLWSRLNASLVRDHDDHPRFVIGMVEDITERKQAEQELRRRARQQALVAQLGQRALDRADVADLMNEAVGVISENLGTEYAGVLKLLPEKDRLVLEAGVGWEEDHIGVTTIEADEDSPAGRVLAEESVVFEDLGSEARFTGRQNLLNRGVVSGMYVVIRGQERPFGVLETHSTRCRKFTKDDVNFVQAVANVLATAIERRKTEEALEKFGREYRRLFEMANDAILVYEPESRSILDVNENACELYGLSKDAFLGKTMKELSLDRQRARRYLETLLTEGSYQDFETVHRRSDGVPLYVLVNSSVIEFGGYKAILSIVRDITNRKRAEQSLHEMREAERRRIARDLHDVVLQDLSGTLQALQATQLESESPGEVGLDREIEALRRAVGGLRNAVYDLRIEKKQPFLKSVESLVELNRQMTPERQIVLDVQGDFPQELESESGVELLRVLQEALANTRRHSNARRVEVTLSKKGRKLAATVTDDGCGFEPGSKPSGVGLSGMRERVEALGGKLKVSSEAGKGTSVRIEIPR